MAFENTIGIINQDIKEINLLIEGFKKYDKIPQIDIDLALSKIRELYDLLLLLEQSNKTTNEVIIEPKEKQTEVKKEPIKPIVQEESKPIDNPITKKTLADQFEGQQKSVNESIAKSSQKDISEKIQSTSIKTIQSAIGINDKFLFIKELFHGDDQKFNNTISQLNSMESYEEAYSHLSNMQWDMKNKITSNFIDIVKRRFTK